MGYRDKEKKRLISLKPTLYSGAACIPGTYNGITYPFCLADPCTVENLYAGIREEALTYFKERNIPWHGGKGKHKCLPSGHLCCSQCACTNFLFSFARDPEALMATLIDLGYPVAEVLPFSGDLPLRDGASPYVAFEWIGERNYLGELSAGKVANDEARTRGSNFTSADFAFRYRRTDGRIEIVLGEWKYTEHYPVGKSIQVSSSNTDRLKRIYRPLLENPHCQIRLTEGVTYADMFYDPFDQMMRLQLLASSMEHAHEQESDIASVLHVAPQANRELMHRITSPGLNRAGLGRDIHDVYKSLVAADRFQGRTMEALLAAISNNSRDTDWVAYLRVRYG